MRPIGLAFLSIVLWSASVLTSLASTEKRLYDFGAAPGDGYFPIGDLVSDKFGNLYGTTRDGGSNGLGTVFTLIPNGSGGWTERVLYSFSWGSSDGNTPLGGVILDAAGNLYGTTTVGGPNWAGTVFTLIPNGSGGWTERVLYSFMGGTDGSSPYAGLVFDKAGSLYGTTYTGGAFGRGTVFKLALVGGVWSETVLHSFGFAGNDGVNPHAGLMIDKAGNLFGTTEYGGGGACNNGGTGCGIIFKLKHSANLQYWTEQVLHRFKGGEGADPVKGRLVHDQSGNLFGTTNYGGTNNFGVVFELKHSVQGWTETVLHNFGGAGDGGLPRSGLAINAKGSLFGTTEGSPNGNGTVFQIKYANSRWNETVLYNFGFYPDGSQPLAGLILDAKGNLYGTTPLGGPNASGTVFEIKLP